MAISMSGATVTTDTRDELLASSIDNSITSGGASPNMQPTGFLGLGGKEATGAALAGITASFASNVSSRIDEYCTTIDNAIEKLSQVDVNTAFKGTGIEGALNNFIESVKTVAKDYTNKLKAAETEIVNSVAQAYQAQDTDLTGDLGSDAAQLGSNNAV